MRRFFCLALFGIAALLPLSAQETEPVRTVIDSNSLEMQGSEERNYFYFRGDVHVRGESLEIRCQELVVTASRAGGQEDTVGEIGAIERIVASGDVEINQAGRRAVAGRAEVDPVAGTVTLSENPRIIDDEVEVEGYQFVFYKDDKRIETIADPNAPADQPSRSRVSLGALPAIQFDQPEERITVLERMDPLNVDSALEEEAEENAESSESAQSEAEAGDAQQ